LAGKKSLDAGCGIGAAIPALYRMGCRDLPALDLSDENIRNAQKRCAGIRDHVRFKTGSLLELDYPADTFDFIVLDYIYVPYQFHWTQAEAEGLLSSAGFRDIRRLKQPVYRGGSSFFGFVKPIYYDPQTWLGRVMVGSGWMCFTARK